MYIDGSGTPSWAKLLLLGRNGEAQSRWFRFGTSALESPYCNAVLSSSELASKVNCSGADARKSSPVTVILSFLCWAFNCLLFLWTHSLACHCLLSSKSSIAMAPWAAPARARKVHKQCVNPYIWVALVRKVRKLCVNPYISPITDIQAQLRPH